MRTVLFFITVGTVPLRQQAGRVTQATRRWLQLLAEVFSQGVQPRRIHTALAEERAFMAEEEVRVDFFGMSFKFLMYMYHDSL